MWELWIEWLGTGWTFAWRLVLLFLAGYILGCLWRIWVLWRTAKTWTGKALTLKNQIKKLPWKRRQDIKKRAKELIDEEKERRQNDAMED